MVYKLVMSAAQNNNRNAPEASMDTKQMKKIANRPRQRREPLTDYRIRQLGAQLKRGAARIVGIADPHDGLDNQTWIIEDLECCAIEHVLCHVRPRWTRYYQEHQRRPDLDTVYEVGDIVEPY